MIEAATKILREEQRLVVGTEHLQETSVAPCGFITLIRVETPLSRECLIHSIRDQKFARCLAILARDDFSEVNARDVFGRTALHLAAASGHVDTCRAILARKDFTNVNIEDYDGRTALEYAVSSGVRQGQEAAKAIRAAGGR